jgi:hypothetical protein
MRTVLSHYAVRHDVPATLDQERSGKYEPNHAEAFLRFFAAQSPSDARPGKASEEMVLTEEQRARIERNRQEALAKRAHAQATGAAPCSQPQPGAGPRRCREGTARGLRVRLSVCHG